MNTRAFTLALIIAVIAMVLVHTYIEDQKSGLMKTYGKEVSVLVASRDIQELELVDDNKVVVKTVPSHFLSPGALKSVKEIENTIATVPILKGEQITKPRITYPGSKTGLARQVSVDKRAIAITVSEHLAVSKLIKPGDRVDVLAAIDYSGGRKDRQKTMTILQDVLILSTGHSMTNAIPIMGVETPTVIKKMNLNTYSQYNTITLELTPFEVQKLVYLLTYSNAKPYLSLRNNNDKKHVRIQPTQIFDILGEDAQEAKAFFSTKYSTQGRK